MHHLVRSNDDDDDDDEFDHEDSTPSNSSSSSASASTRDSDKSQINEISHNSQHHDRESDRPTTQSSQQRYFRSWADQLHRAVKSRDGRFYSNDGTLTLETTMEGAMFKLLFDGKGEVYKPTLCNKAKPTNTIIEFAFWHRVRDLFSSYDVTLNKEIQVPVVLDHRGKIYKGKTSAPLQNVKAELRSLVVEYDGNRKLKLSFDAKIDYFSLSQLL